MPNYQVNSSISDWIDYLDFNQKLNNKKQKVIKFIFLWMRYNEYYNTNYNDRCEADRATGIHRDGKAIGVYNKQKTKIIASFEKILSPTRGIREGIYRNDNSLQVEFSANRSDLYDFLLLIYKIRCNFFHGEKSPNYINVDLICWAYDSLSKFLKAYDKSFFK